MSKPIPSSSRAIELPPEQFAAAFPFHIAADENLRIIQVGSSLQRVCPELAAGTSLADSFRCVRPKGELSLEWIKDKAGSFFLIEHLHNKLQLRGEFIILPKEETLLFLGSPWFTEPAEIANYGLGFEDFAIHDAMMDMMQVYQTSKMALDDAKELAKKLTLQRSELRRTNDRLRQQEAETKKLALIAARTDNAVVLTDAKGLIIWVNEGFVRLTGYSLEEVAGKTPGTILQGPGTDPSTRKRIREHLLKGEGFVEEILNYAKDGHSYWLSIEVQPIFDENKRLTNFMAIETDISERRAAEQRLAVQFEVSRILSEAQNLSAAIPRLLQAVCERLHRQVGMLWRLSDGSLKFEEVWHPPSVSVGNFVSFSRTLRLQHGEGLPGRIWATLRPAWISDKTKAPNSPRAEIANQENLHSAFGFPVFVRGSLWGVVEFFSTNIEEPDESLLQTFATLGNHIGQFVVRREAEEALRKTNLLQQAIMESANYSIIAANPDGIIHTFNQAAERMLGYKSAEITGKVTPAIIHDPLEIAARANELSRELGRPISAGFEAFVAKAALGKPDENEWTYIRKDGSRFPVLLSVTALFDDRGKVTGYLGVASDITERKRSADELMQAKEAAEAANRAKSDFLAVMSHEIRTPMNAVLGMTNLLLESNLDAHQKELAGTIEQSGKLLLEIINDILDFSKIEAGEHFPLEYENFSCHELVDGVVQLLTPHAEAKNIKLSARWGTNIPEALKGDAGRLRQVLVNLVGNAVKFTDRDGVKIHVESQSSNNHDARIRFTVEDSGIGIPPDKLPLLFEPFTQVDGSASRRRGGTGLGLAICKRIVDMMGGQIGVESQLGHGSKFWFELELEQSELPEITSGYLSPSPDSNSLTESPDSHEDLPSRPLRILVAEDNAINRRLAMFVLEKLGYRADFAGNGMEAVEAWEHFAHDLIFMDCQMPEMDGFEATQEIRRRETLRHTPRDKRVQIVALTANALKGDRERCIAAGMDSYISKPFTARQIKNALNSCSPQIKVCATSNPVTYEPNAAVNFDPQPLVRLVSELGLPAVRELVQDFANDLPGRVQLLKCPPENGTFTMLARQAHSLRGAGITFGLVALAELLLAMETAAYEENLEEIKRLEASIKASSAISLAALQDWLRVDAD